MEEKRVRFRYFHDPYAFSSYLDEPATCSLCNRAAPGFEGPFKGDERLKFVCTECLVSGKLVEAGIETNTADMVSLRIQILADGFGVAPAGEELEKILKERTLELATRTPPLVSWQELPWPVHCGDYCRFLREAGKTDYRRFAAGKEPRAFFRSTLREVEKADEDYLWDGMRPDSPRDGSNPYSLSFYLFQCLKCSSYVSLWDEEE